MTHPEVGFEEQKNKIRICGVVRDNGACGMYRIKQPFFYLNNEEGMDVALGGVDCKDSDLYTLLEDCDIAVIPRPASIKMLELIDILKSHKPPKKVIVDHDDNIFNLNPYSPHYRDMGTEEFTVELDGKKLIIWEDGVTHDFDIERNKRKTEAAKECLRRADGISVTTPELAEYYKQFNDNVFVLPNCIDLGVWKPVDIVSDDKIRITWHGGCSHYNDLVEVKEVFENITRRHKQVKLDICGHEFTGLWKNIPKGQYEFHRWVPTAAHPFKQALLNSDIAVIPLKDDLFNRCKSAIKWVEYSALEVPCVVRNIPPYSNVVEHEYTGLLYDTSEECEAHIERLIKDDVIRKKIGRTARQYITEHFDAETTSHLWADAMKKVMEEPCLSLP